MLGLQSTPVLGSTLDDLVLRVRGTSRDGQVVRLRSPKCTIGSARDCTLRLMARGVQPLHCLILRSHRGTLVRCWSSGTHLNGRDFTDAMLVPGDRLSVGPVELEILAPAVSPPARAPRPPVAAEPPVVAEAPVAAEAPEALPTQWSELQARNQAFAEECRLWQAKRQETEEQLARQTGELETKAAALEAQRLAMEEERRRWESTRGEGGRESAEQAEALEARRTELDEWRKSLEQKHRTLDAERRQWEMQCRHEELSRQAEVDSLRNELANARRVLEDRLASMATVDAERETNHDLALAYGAGAGSAIAAETAEPQSREADPEELPRATVTDSPACVTEPVGRPEVAMKEPVNLAEVFRAMGITPPEDDEPMVAPGRSPLASIGRDERGELDRRDQRDEAMETDRPCPMGGMPSGDEELDESGDDARDFNSARPAAAVTEPAPTAARSHGGSSAPAHDGDGEEESIHEYMAQLLQRVGASPEAIERQSQLKLPSRGSEPIANEPAPTATAGEPAKPAEHKPLKKLPSRATGPEKALPLSAMRELANLQAETAITRYARSKAHRVAASKMFITIIAALSGSVLLVLCRQGADPMKLYAAALSLVIAVWSGQFVLQTRRPPARSAAQRPSLRKMPLERVLSPDDFTIDAMLGPRPEGERVKDEG